MLKNIGLLALLFLFCIPKIYAQKLEVGLGSGFTYYKGDLQPTFRVFNPSIGVNTFVRYNHSKSLSAKAQGFIGRVTGNDAKSGDIFLKDRGFKFFNDLYDYNAQIEYNFLNFRTHNGRYESKYTPYLFGGFGGYDLRKSNFYNQVLTGTKFKKQLGFNPIMNFGVGYKTLIQGQWNFSVDFNTRIFIKTKKGLGTDNFDGLSYVGGAVDINNYNVTNLPASHEYANTTQKDKYFYLSFSVSYLFYKVHCPPGR